MMVQFHDLPDQEASSPPLSYGERLALWTLRCVMMGPQLCNAVGSLSWDQGQDLARMASSLRAFRDMRRAGCREIEINCSASVLLTRDERCILRALAIAQTGDEQHLDDCLHTLALDRPCRTKLAEAVRMLAATLAVRGHWLPLRRDRAQPVPAGALAVARVRREDMRGVRVAWPGRHSS